MGADINKLDLEGNSAAVTCIDFDRSECLKELIKVKGHTMLEEVDHKNTLITVRAIRSRKDNCLRVFMESYGELFINEEPVVTAMEQTGMS